MQWFRQPATSYPGLRTLTSGPRVWMRGVVLLLLCALVSGVGVRVQADAALIAHYVVNAASAVALALFLRQHWWLRRERLNTHRNAHIGKAMLMCLLLLWLSGLALLVWTNVAPLRALHSAFSVGLAAFLLWHAAWRTRLASKLRTRLKVRFAFASLIALTAVLAWQFSVVQGSPVAANAQHTNEPVVRVAHAGLKTGALASAQACADCHADISQQWRGSAHANALNDRYYQALAGMFMQERGAEAVRYCASCHNPIGLLQGEIDVRLAHVGKPSVNAYEARGLGGSLPISKLAAEGVSCVMCHRAADAEPSTGALSINPRALLLPTETQAQLALQAAPAAHRGELSPAVLKRSEMCGACHNLRTPDGLLLEPTFDEWRASRFAREGVSCQDCHMPATLARKVDSALPTMIRAHGGQPGAPSSLSGMDAGSDLLTRAAAVRVATGHGLITVTVMNTGTGHYLPTGADDLREVWLELHVFDAMGQLLWQSGTLDNYGALPADAVRFGKVLGDVRGQPIALHRFWQATRILQDSRLAPDEIRLLSFDKPPAGVRVVARLRYRDVSPAFAEFALSQPSQPAIRDIAIHNFQEPAP